MAWLRGKSTESKQRDERLADRSPFRRDDPVDSASDSARERRITHDAETRALIQTELADATVDERNRLLADFESLEPHVIKRLLKLRRLEQQREQVALAGGNNSAAIYDGLGAAFPGSNRRASPDSGFGHGEVQQVSATRNEWGRGLNGRGFGHSQSFASQVEAPVINPLPGNGPRNHRLPGRSSQFSDRQDAIAQNPFADRQFEDRQWDAGANRDALGPQKDRSVIPASGQAAPSIPAQMSPTNHTTNLQRPADATQRRDDSRNPLQFVGIDTSPVRRPTAEGTLPAQGEPAAKSAQWNDALQRLVVAAEEQVYAAQTAWSEANQLSADGDVDEKTRREMIAARRQEYVKKQVDLRMLYLMSGQQARALERVSEADPANQEFWTQMMWSLANYFDVEGIPNGDDRATQTVTQLRTAIQHLQETAKLEIRNVDFCTKISSFGNYETFDNNVFRPGQPVMVYAEIENFTSQRGSDGVFRTQLKSTIEVHRVRPQGSEVLETIDFDATTDLCRNHRRDYYHSYELQIPAQATSGSYALVLIVEDQFSKRVATYSRNFTVE